MDITAQDVRKYISQIKSMKWLGLAVHLQRSALGQRKYHLVRITIVADDEGNPVFWTEPECTPIAPGKGAINWLNQL